MRVSIVKMPFLEQEYIKFSEKWEYIEDEYLGLEIVESILTQNNCLEKIYNISSAESIIEDIITNNPDVIMLSVMQSSAKNTYDFINSFISVP